MPLDSREVRLHDVTVRYGRRIALQAISGAFAPGSLTAVIGANGAGKSTLLAAIAGTVSLAAGSIERPPPARLAYLPQRASIDRDYPISVAELIALGGWQNFGAFRGADAAMRLSVAAAANAVDLTERLQRPIAALSVGEFQRALFARVILQDAGLILLDEPFAAVDAQTAAVLSKHVVTWHREGRTVIVVLHDLALARTLFPSALLLAQRCVAWGETPTVLAAMP